MLNRSSYAKQDLDREVDAPGSAGIAPDRIVIQLNRRRLNLQQSLGS